MGNRLLDAATTLVGWVNHSATEPYCRTLESATSVKLSTPLEAAEAFTFIASHPGAEEAVTFSLEVAPELEDGTVGTWVNVATVAVPAEGGRVEAPISGSSLQADAADAELLAHPTFVYARGQVQPEAVPGAYAGLSF